MSSGTNEESVALSMPIKCPYGGYVSAVHPNYLHSNSTSHTWPFSAIAELADNAYDPDVKASQLKIDQQYFEKDGTKFQALTFTDNGHGMTHEKIYYMLSFGFCDKIAIKGHKPVGHYGNGFKSGSMRLGKDALVFTKSKFSRSLGFLSQTYLKSKNATNIIVPIVTWDKATDEIEDQDDENQSLPEILKHSVINTQENVDTEFNEIANTGTRIIIYNLRSTKDSKLEFDFKSSQYDIKLSDELNSDENEYKREERQNHIPASDYSLRAYLSILYLKPRMKIFLRNKKVITVVISKSLSKTLVDTYKPKEATKNMKIVFGFSQNVNHYGIMMYHQNRLIKPYVRVGYQLKPNHMGVGVIGVIECDMLKPTHNKQDFIYTPLFRSTMFALGVKLNDYWNEKCGTNQIQPLPDSLPDEIWVQCDNEICLKWRKLPDGVKPSELPEKWYCSFHPDKRWSSCDVPEEEEDPECIKPYEKTVKKRERYLKEKQRQTLLGLIMGKDQENVFQSSDIMQQRLSNSHMTQQNNSHTTQQNNSHVTQQSNSHMTHSISNLTNAAVLNAVASVPSVNGVINLEPEDAKPIFNSEPSRLHSTMSTDTGGSVKRPIVLADSDDEEEAPKKIIKTEETDKTEKVNNIKTENEGDGLTAKQNNIRKRLFQLSQSDLQNIDPDIIGDLKQQTVQSLGLILAQRSQRLRNIKIKVYTLIESLLTDVELPNVNKKDIDDNSIEELLDHIIEANGEMNDAESN